MQSGVLAADGFLIKGNNLSFGWQGYEKYNSGLN